MEKQKLQERFDELADILKEEMNPQGFWTGELSSSALGVAVAVAAFHFHDKETHQKEIAKGLVWLQNNVNSDGGFGDTPESPANVSTSLLVYAATNLYAQTNPQTAELHNKIESYLSTQGIDVRSPQVAKAILDHYQKDYTFSVPILTMCGLCGVPGKEAFNYVPQLPFELSLLPRKFYRMLNLSVVSYAVPALIAVGIVVFKKKNSGAFWRVIRRKSIKPVLFLLNKLMPASGGFLEAIPLTAFVSLSLIEAGFGDLEIVEKGIGFLKRTQRSDGGWPIDVDLSTWVTTLSVKSLRNKVGEVLTNKEQTLIVRHLLATQEQDVHPFNGSAPGGWGWTNFSGSVPDGDDTPGAILALLRLQPSEKVREAVLAGCHWLIKLQNSDGGFPTFSKGWGKLPFDQSCADLTGHGILALSACLEAYGNEIEVSKSKAIRKSIGRALTYLEKHQQDDGSWLPLWFGNQQTSAHENPVYGTARVTSYLNDTICHQWSDGSQKKRIGKLIGFGEQFLVKVQNEDGSWGGGKNVPGTIEETALAISALIGKEYGLACDRGLCWLDQYYGENGLKSAPIGLYFASLWYDEKLYPTTSYLEAVTRKLEAFSQVGQNMGICSPSVV